MDTERLMDSHAIEQEMTHTPRSGGGSNALAYNAAPGTNNNNNNPYAAPSSSSSAAAAVTAGSPSIPPPTFQPMGGGAAAAAGAGGSASVPPVLAHSYSPMPGETELSFVEWNDGCFLGRTHHLNVTSERVVAWNKDTCCACGFPNEILSEDVVRISRCIYEKTHFFGSALVALCMFVLYMVAAVIFIAVVPDPANDPLTKGGGGGKWSWGRISGFAYIAFGFLGVAVLRFLIAWCYPVFAMTIHSGASEPPFLMYGKVSLDAATLAGGNTEHAIRSAQGVVDSVASPAQLAGDMCQMFPGEEEHLHVAVGNSDIRVTSRRLIVERAACCGASCGDRAVITEPIRNISRLGSARTKLKYQTLVGVLVLLIGGAMIGVANSGVLDPVAGKPVVKTVVAGSAAPATVFVNGTDTCTRTGFTAWCTSGCPQGYNAGCRCQMGCTQWLTSTTECSITGESQGEWMTFPTACTYLSFPPTPYNPSQAVRGVGITLIVVGVLVLLYRRSSIVFHSFVLPAEDIIVYTGGRDHSAEIEAAVRFAQRNLKK